MTVVCFVVKGGVAWCKAVASPILHCAGVGKGLEWLHSLPWTGISFHKLGTEKSEMPQILSNLAF